MKYTAIKLFLTFFFLVSCDFIGHALSPIFTNYDSGKYGVSNQNWSLAQDINGYIYAGNDRCLLRFNGKSWEKLYPFGKQKDIIVRSLYADKSSERIYVGAYREFGYFVMGPDGELRYTSLSEDISDEQAGNDQIWYITRVKNKIFFIYFSSYYIYDIDTDEVTIHYAPTSYYYSLGGCLYMAQRSGKIRKYDGVTDGYADASPDSLPGPAMKVFESSSGARIAVCEREGLFVQTPGGYRRADSLGEGWGIANRAIQCRDGTVIVGFRGSGIYAFSESGHTLWHLDSDNGLANNTIHALLEDDCGNVWAALAKGITVIFKDGDSMIPYSGSNSEEITCSHVSGDRLYIGTKRGLEIMNLPQENGMAEHTVVFKTGNQVWSISETMGQIIVGDNENTYRLEKNNLEILSLAPGGTEPKLIAGNDGQWYMVQGSFTFLYIYELDGNGKWRFRNTVDGFLRPVRKMEIDHLGNVWLEHMYEGLFRLSLSGDLRNVVSIKHWNDYHKHVCKVGGNVLFHDKDGFCYYDDFCNEFKPYDAFNDRLGEFTACESVITVSGDRYWLVKEDRAVLVHLDKDGLPEILDYLNCSKYGMSMTEPFYTISSWGDDRFIVGTDMGLLVHSKDSGKKRGEVSPKILIRQVASIKGDGRILHDISYDRITVSNKSDVAVSVALVGESFPNHVEIESLLSGYDYSARMLGEDMVVSYHRLPAGNYNLVLRAYDALGNEIAVKDMILSVKPPLLASNIFLVLYLLVFTAFCYMSVSLVRKLLEHQRVVLAKKNAEAMEQEQLRHEKELMSVRNMQLEESVLLKSKELATYSLIEAQRNNVLKHLSSELSKIYFNDGSGFRKRDYDRLMQIIHEGEFSEDNWDHFFRNFDLIHKSFFRSLKTRHEDLTSNDLRLCAYLRLNMSTKEIASIMGITVKSAEVAKYRLRKKLKVDSSIPLTDYLISLLPPGVGNIPDSISGDMPVSE